MAASLAGASASDLLRSSTSNFSGVPLRTLGKGKLVLKRRDFTVAAKLKKYRKREYPWPANPDPNVTGGVLSHLCRFKPLTEKPKRITLDFEKPLLDLQKKITDVRKMANDTGLDFSDQILSLESKYQQALKDLYIRLTPIQRVHIARHPNRPTFFDHILNITEKFVEIHGDRAGYDDPATVTGIGTIDGKRYMFIGQQKGRNTKENIQRNFGMSTPHGYRKALRMMKYADHHGFPIVTFIDTPGAYADLESEEKGQGEAIAQNLRTMFGLKVPILSIVIGEGGSGGALAIGCANKLLMLENAVFYVASPEACAAILWKNSKAAPKAAEKLKITAPELCKLEVADGVIPEPLGGAHADPEWTSQQIKKAINETMAELTEMNTEDLLKHRMHKFRKIGGFGEGVPMDPSKKFSMKKRDLSITKMPDVELGVEIEKLKQQILDAKKSSPNPPKLDLEEMIKQLEREIDQEYSEAVKATGLTDRLLKLREEVSKANADNQVIDPLLKDFEQGLRAYPNYNRVQNMVKYLKELYELQDKEAVTLKQELKKQVDNVLSNPRTREKFEALKAEIESVNASSPSDLDDELKKKIVEFKKEIDLQLVNALESMNLEVIPNINIPDTEELKKIDSLVNSSDDIKSKIQQLKLEVLKAGETPDSESKNRIDILVQQIKQSLIEAIDSSGLKDQIVNPAEDSLTDSELRVKVGTNRSVS